MMPFEDGQSRARSRRPGRTPMEDMDKRRPDEGGTNWTEEIMDWLKCILTAIVLVFVLNTFIIINARIPSASMENTIMTHDRLIGLRFAYWYSVPRRGDIVLFRYPLDEKTIYIKRVIGESGDHVEIHEGRIYINGSEEPLEEPYLKEEWVSDNDGYVFDVPDRAILVLGDNRNISQDARFWADLAIEEGLADNAEEAERFTYVTDGEVLGRAVWKYWKGFDLLTDN